MNPPEDMRAGQVVQPNGPNEAISGIATPTVPQNTTPLPPSAETSNTSASQPQVSAPLPPLEPSYASAETVDSAEPTWYARSAEDETPSPQMQADPHRELSWVGEEFVAHDKNARWFIVLGGAGLLVTLVIYLATKDKFTTGIIIFTAIAFGLFAARKPKQQSYRLSGQDLQVGNKSYGLHDFKSFSADDEGGVTSVVFMPLKRFMPPLTIYVPQNIEHDVTSYLTAFLPFEARKADAVDSLMRRIHF